MDRDGIVKEKIDAVMTLSGNVKVEGKVFTTVGVRLVDELNVSQRKFLPVEKATITTPGSQGPEKLDLVLINKDSIMCAWPVENPVES